jgi:hypothetical protein
LSEGARQDSEEMVFNEENVVEKVVFDEYNVIEKMAFDGPNGGFFL